MLNLFFKRNSKLFMNDNFIKLSIVLIFFTLALVANSLGKGGIVKKVINYSFPIVPAMVVCLCDTGRYCKILFSNCDRFLLKRDNNKDKVLDNFVFCLGRILMYNAIPVLTLSLAYLVAGALVYPAGSMMPVLQVCLGIILFGITFTVLGMLLYYVFQPYDFDGNTVGNHYLILRIIIFALCYICTFTSMSNEKILFLIGIVTAAVVALSVTIIYFFGTKTFRLKNK